MKNNLDNKIISLMIAIIIQDNFKKILKSMKK